MKKTPNIQNLIAQLAAKESAFLAARFLAPVAGEGVVQVRISGAICRLRIRPSRFSGWGVFQPTSYTHAQLHREATMTERRQYLELFPATRLILTERQGTAWLARPALLNDQRCSIEGDAVLYGVDDGEQFDTVIARFDGGRFWFDQIDPQADPAAGAHLREALVRMLDPRLLVRPGLTPGQRLAYAALHAARVEQRLRSAQASREQRLRSAQDAREQRLKAAVQHAGGVLRGFSEIGDAYRVTFTLDGQRHISVVRKNDLTVQTAGVCLSGQDNKFDLSSLVSVLREGQKQGIYHGLEV